MKSCKGKIFGQPSSVNKDGGRFVIWIEVGVEGCDDIVAFLSVFIQQLAEYQQRKRDDKIHEADRRRKTLSEDPVDITPKNKGAFPWTGKNLDNFEKEWSMKSVTVKGFFDHSKEY